MIKEANNSAINVRYSELSKTSCCLSCGEALGHSKPQPGEICLDLGSGRGNDVIRMAESAGKDGFAYGIDISDGMLEKARKKCGKTWLIFKPYFKRYPAITIKRYCTMKLFSKRLYNKKSERFR